jgi:uncharacterized protein YcbX
MIHRKLTEIWIYPIKSLPGFRVTSATVREKGLEGDRRMMLVDENNRFLTQRELHQMALFQVSMDQGFVTVSHRTNKDLHPITIDATQPVSTPAVACTIWDDTVEAHEMNAMYSKWFSDALGFTCKLMLFPEPNKRRVDVKYVAEEIQTSLSDGYPYLIIGQESLNDISKRVGEDLPIRRFRPNFFFEGGTAFEEDTWKDFYIGPIKFRGIKPCGRCAITTINPDTGEKGVEPLKTLASYRNKNGKVLFGQNVIALGQGIINEGDDISVSEV